MNRNCASRCAQKRFCTGKGTVTVIVGGGESEVSQCINCEGAGALTCTTCQGSGIQPRYLDRRYIGSIVQSDGEIDGDIISRIQVGWLKWRNAPGLLYQNVDVNDDIAKIMGNYSKFSACNTRIHESSRTMIEIYQLNKEPKTILLFSDHGKIILNLVLVIREFMVTPIADFNMVSEHDFSFSFSSQQQQQQQAFVPLRGVGNMNPFSPLCPVYLNVFSHVIMDRIFCTTHDNLAVTKHNEYELCLQCSALAIAGAEAMIFNWVKPRSLSDNEPSEDYIWGEIDINDSSHSSSIQNLLAWHQEMLIEKDIYVRLFIRSPCLSVYDFELLIGHDPIDWASRIMMVFLRIMIFSTVRQLVNKGEYDRYLLSYKRIYKIASYIT
ncbi:hypothetical protein IEQ34_015087 [Dendrobium chrysotoxum]|uniref:Uncharacterized protein n=1 Tax=Dendrobium chrysotoxum TaxID=161865 RepID=A0AAV7GLX7_DENCH|nr:hypothetical protein IEQ34_015087 [Dendrobium chrysotoxum]